MINGMCGGRRLNGILLRVLLEGAVWEVLVLSLVGGDSQG